MAKRRASIDDSDQYEAEFEALGLELLDTIFSAAIARGELSFKGKTPDEIERTKQRFVDRLKSNSDKGLLDFKPVWDHRHTLLTHARHHLKSGEEDLAALFYATRVDPPGGASEYSEWGYGAGRKWPTN